ncbi:LuxR C-terminal-related transcriptional regulator [Microbacterium fluvii]|uniref:LuxR C-terminal-related transcriptional regulator n=1 Tax=Microbacterium fluvii TaxID=415215 RepID=A0ABW2HG98_9MICO|nr:helix-turn-helix transcriptional regulator [Microbacterium fluvii]MCU4673173.1 helix-turn-helix transcriptional regulator [Microbacterium fluvii]
MGCVEDVFDTVVATLRALATGDRFDQCVCRMLMERLRATAAAVITLDIDDRQATIVAWPHTVDILRMKVVLSSLPQTFPMLMRHLVAERRVSCLSRDTDVDSWRGTIATLLLEGVLGSRDIAQLPLGAGPSAIRLAVVCRRDDFSERDLHFLSCLAPPLADLATLAASPGRVALAPGAPALTGRELEVLRLMAQGLIARAIATRLAVSPRTVHKHLANVYRKLDAHDRLIAVRTAERLGLLDPAPPAASALDAAVDLRW